MSGAPRETPHRSADEPPPILGSWRRVYAAVLVYLALIVVAFYVFTRVFDT